MISKIAGRSAKELIFKCYQYVWNAQDRLRLKNNRAAMNWRGSYPLNEGGFFISLEECDRIRREYAHYPEFSTRLLARADAICAHRFDVLGFSGLSYDTNGNINWHHDPIAGVTLSAKWWQETLATASHDGSDPKIIWELNRHHHLVTLAQAFVITGDERYRAEIVAQLDSWMDANPPKFGVNWSSSLELSYRLIAWLWSWFLCGGGDAFGPLTERFLQFVALQAEHIEHNLSVYYSPNTHLSGEALGLYYVGTLLPELQAAQRWRDIGRKWLMHCLDEHILADGGYMERTLWYHRYTFDIYLHFYLLSLKNNEVFSNLLTNRLEALGHFILYSLRPDRKLPHFGDDDGGRLLALDGLPGDDPLGALHMLALLFECEECAWASDEFSEEALWLLGSHASKSFIRIRRQEPRKTSRVFGETGYAFLRSDWSDKGVYIGFDCGPHGWLNSGHAHADMLSVQVYAGGHAIISDPGTFSYQSPWRDWFRGAESHAVVRVDGAYPVVPAGPFHWEKVPKFCSLKQYGNGAIDYIAGAMDAGLWRHTREVFFLKPSLILLLDTIDGSGSHEIEARFPLVDVAWQIAGDMCASTLPTRVCTIQWEAGALHRTALLDGWQSECYGRRQESRILVFTVRAKLPQTFATLIDLSGSGLLIRRAQETGVDVFSVVAHADGGTIATVRSSFEGDAVCAAFAE